MQLTAISQNFHPLFQLYYNNFHEKYNKKNWTLKQIPYNKQKLLVPTTQYR